MDKAIYRNTKRKKKEDYDPDHETKPNKKKKYLIYKVNIVQIKPVIVIANRSIHQ